MPHRPRVFCPHPTQQRPIDRPNANARGYTYRWQQESKAFLQDNPICNIRGPDCTIKATCVDHVIPHRGDYALFWDQTNWQSACKPCHDAKTGRGG